MTTFTLGHAQWLARECGWSLQRTLSFLWQVMAFDPQDVLLEIERQEARGQEDTVRITHIN